jgi:hypothetical protein
MTKDPVLDVTGMTPAAMTKAVGTAYPPAFTRDELYDMGVELATVMVDTMDAESVAALRAQFAGQRAQLTSIGATSGWHDGVLDQLDRLSEWT